MRLSSLLHLSHCMSKCAICADSWSIPLLVDGSFNTADSRIPSYAAWTTAHPLIARGPWCCSPAAMPWMCPSSTRVQLTGSSSSTQSGKSLHFAHKASPLLLLGLLSPLYRKKANRLIQHPSLDGVQRAKLSQTKSAFWRFHTKGVADEVSVKVLHNQWSRLSFYRPSVVIFFVIPLPFISPGCVHNRGVVLLS